MPKSLATAPLLGPDGDDARYFYRELSWLALNERVLANAFDTNLPLGERLRFITISASNLDEFYMVRIAGLRQLATRNFLQVIVERVAGLYGNGGTEVAPGEDREQVPHQEAEDDRDGDSVEFRHAFLQGRSLTSPAKPGARGSRAFVDGITSR